MGGNPNAVKNPGLPESIRVEDFNTADFVLAEAQAVDAERLPLIGPVLHADETMYRREFVIGRFMYTPLPGEVLVSIGVKGMDGKQRILVFCGKPEGEGEEELESAHQYMVDGGEGVDVFDTQALHNVEITKEQDLKLPLSEKGKNRGRANPRRLLKTLHNRGDQVEALFTFDPYEQTPNENNLKIAHHTRPQEIDAGEETGDFPHSLVADGRKGGHQYGPREFPKLDGWHPDRPDESVEAEVSSALPQAVQEVEIKFSNELFDESVDLVFEAIQNLNNSFTAEDEGFTPEQQEQLEKLFSADNREVLKKIIAGDMQGFSTIENSFAVQWNSRVPLDISEATVAAIKLLVTDGYWYQFNAKNKVPYERARELTKGKVYSRITKFGNFIVDNALANQIIETGYDVFGDYEYHQSLTDRMIMDYSVDEALDDVFIHLGIELERDQVVAVIRENLLKPSTSSENKKFPVFWQQILTAIANPENQTKVRVNTITDRAVNIIGYGKPLVSKESIQLNKGRVPSEQRITEPVQDYLFNTILEYLKLVMYYRMRAYNNSGGKEWPSLEDEEDFMGTFDSANLMKFLQREKGILVAKPGGNGYTNVPIPESMRSYTWKTIENILLENLRKSESNGGGRMLEP